MRGLSLVAAWSAMLAGCLLVWRMVIVVVVWIVATMPLEP